MFWPPVGKNWLIGKDPDSGKDWRQEKKETTEDEMIGYHHHLDGHELEQTLRVGDGQGRRACWCPWDCKESHTLSTWTELIHSVRFLNQKQYIKHLYLSLVRELFHITLHAINRNKVVTCPIKINVWMSEITKFSNYLPNPSLSIKLVLVGFPKQFIFDLEITYKTIGPLVSCNSNSSCECLWLSSTGPSQITLKILKFFVLMHLFQFLAKCSLRSVKRKHCHFIVVSFLLSL